MRIHGGADATGVTLALRYSGDDVEWCGNDIKFWWKWIVNFGGGSHPIVIIKGTPVPTDLLVNLQFGHKAVPDVGPVVNPLGPAQGFLVP